MTPPEPSVNGVRPSSSTSAATAAATAARRRAKDERLLSEIVARLPLLDRDLLAAFVFCGIDEVERRAQVERLKSIT